MALYIYIGYQGDLQVISIARFRDLLYRTNLHPPIITPPSNQTDQMQLKELVAQYYRWQLIDRQHCPNSPSSRFFELSNKTTLNLDPLVQRQYWYNISSSSNVTGCRYQVKCLSCHGRTKQHKPPQERSISNFGGNGDVHRTSSITHHLPARDSVENLAEPKCPGSCCSS